ncbi:UNVERIFIED_CONTAM: hypothetical protein PYX00_002092 [Menopon gallinae]|uniref:G-protein coupled receptors family 1 profile domain-containing protein n=1 Tax=Menopon gallinae TaxID=328185 RepID=A0AAW2IF07_9NEOP
MDLSDESEVCEATENITRIILSFKRKWPTKDWEKYGFFNEKYLLKINSYWLQFPPPPMISHYILGVLYFFIMVIGASGNLVFIVMFIRRKSLRTPSNIFIMNLAVSDLFLMLKMPIFIYNSFLLGPAMGDFGCSFYGFFGGLTGTASIMTLSAIAFDRYQVIGNPLARKLKHRIYFQILFIWLYSAFFATIPLLDIGLNRYVPEGYLTSCSFDYLSEDYGSRILIVVFFIAAWVVPVSVIITSYTAIYKIILKTQKKNAFEGRHCKKMNARNSEIKAAFVIMAIICLWIFAWTPYAVVALLGVTGNKKYITPMASMIPALFCKLASCIDPYVYAIANTRFRKEFRVAISTRASPL